MNIYQEIKTQITAADAARAYGIHIGKNGLARCPFHNDHHPSMLVRNRFHCFGCGVSGDAVDLTARLFGLTLYEAAVKLISDFSLPISMNDEYRQVSEETLHAKRKEQEKNQAERERCRKLRLQKIDQLKSMLNDLQGVENCFRTVSPEEAMESDSFTTALDMKSRVNHWLDILCLGTEEEWSRLLGKEVWENGNCKHHNQRSCSPSYGR